MQRIALLLLAYTLGTSPVAAKTITIGSATIELPIPEGSCELDRTHPVDAEQIQDYERFHATLGQRVLLTAANCAEIETWREGNGELDHLWRYATVIKYENTPLPEASDAFVNRHCAEFRAKSAKGQSELGVQLNALADRIGPTLVAKEMKVLTAAVDAGRTCHIIALQKQEIEPGVEAKFAIFDATTVVKGRIIFQTLSLNGSRTFPDRLKNPE